MARILSSELLDAFTRALIREERAPGTIAKYLRDLRRFSAWLDGAPVTKEAAAAWKAHLNASHYAPTTVNSMLSAVNRLFAHLGWTDCRVRFLRIQRRLFRDPARALSREEYERLRTAAGAQPQLALLMETICATGIRVSEVRYITVEAARAGSAEIRLKGKIRTILLPQKLCRKLLGHARARGLGSGPVFRGRGGGALSRQQIWRGLKGLCGRARVSPGKVFPHNLRRLFATIFYQVSRNLVQLADLLGHSSIETTRLYLQTTGADHVRSLERMRLIC